MPSNVGMQDLRIKSKLWATMTRRIDPSFAPAIERAARRDNLAEDRMVQLRRRRRDFIFDSRNLGDGLFIRWTVRELTRQLSRARRQFLHVREHLHDLIERATLPLRLLAPLSQSDVNRRA